MIPSITNLPHEVLIDNILPYISLKDIISLTATSKDFYAVCSDNTFWKRKLKEDYNVSDALTARTKRYKFLYKRVHNSNLYTWGPTLGLGHLTFTGYPRHDRLWPTKLENRGPRFVDVASGDWFLHILDSEGSMYAWGELRRPENLMFSGSSLGSDEQFARLLLPEKVTQISSGDIHSMALSSLNNIWVFMSWGIPYRMTTPLLSSPRQVACGRDLSAVLTNDGEVFVWWPLEGTFDHLFRSKERAIGGVTNRNNGEIICQTWDVPNDPNQVFDVAITLPNLRGEDQPVGEKIVKIAAGRNFLIALTEGGHVLKVDFPEGAESFDTPHHPRWEYLNKFSEREHIQSNPTFNPAHRRDGEHILDVPQDFRVTRISARSLTFYAYSTGTSSIVLRGRSATSSSASADIPRALQHRDIIYILLDDYHVGALTSTGKLLTWGAFVAGALGLRNDHVSTPGEPDYESMRERGRQYMIAHGIGDTELPVGIRGACRSEEMREAAKMFMMPANPHEPTEVKFGTETGRKARESFVFGVAASTCHNGALVIDLEGAEDEDDKSEGSSMPEILS